MTTTRLLAAGLCAALMSASIVAADENWPNWRGPNQNGVSSSTNLPDSWDSETNIVWKTELPSWGGGTPVVWGDHIFLTSPSTPDPEELKKFAEQQEQNQGRRRRGGGRHPGGQDLLLLCLSRTDGSIIWQRKIGQGNKLHMKSNNSSPSPVTDGKTIWVVSGTGVVNAFDYKGKMLWQHDLQAKYGTFGHNWGYASSPLLFDGMLIAQVLHGSHTDDPSYVVAFKGDTGEIVWRQERPTDAPREAPDAYTTPIAIKQHGKDQIVITGGDYVTGHDPKTGTELWRTGGLNPRKAANYRIVASPMFVDGIIYAPTRVRPLLALKADDQTDPAAEPIWKWDAPGSPDVPTPCCDGKRFYMVNDAGMVTCVNAKTGETIWGPERTVRGTVSSSLLMADGKLFFTNEEGVTVVLAAADEYKLLATNELDGSYTLSTPIAADNHLFIRTGEHLYCIGQKTTTAD